VDDTVIYMRTPVGTTVARDSSTALPRAMRTLLLAVDGRTRVASYRMILSHLGDVGLLLQGLENAGYIARTTGSNTRVAAPTVNVAPATPTRSSIAQDLRSLAAMTSLQTTTEQSRPESIPVKNYDVLAKINEVQSHFTQFPSTLSGHQRNPQSVVRTANLNKAKSLMTDFLITHLPQVAMEVGLSIDRIDSVDELQRSLEDYSQLIAKLGRVSAEHLHSVRALLK
jgi:hypothetical protein